MPVLQSEYESLRENISPELAHLSDAQLENLFERYGVDAEAMEGFFSDLGKFASSAGKAVLQAAPSILPLAGTVVGTAFGGPIGAKLGGSLGSLAGQAVGSATGQKGAGGGGLGGLLSGGLGSLLGGGGLSSLMGGSPAAGQLLQTIAKPETMKALASMAMGPMGTPNIPVGGTSVPVGAFGNLLKMLTGRMEAEYAEAIAKSKGDGTPGYMKDYAGEAKADPAVAENRAEVLYELLQASGREAEQERSEAEAESESELAEQEMEAMQAEYDAIELMEVYESEDA